MGLTRYHLAKDLGVPPSRTNEIVKGQRAITADTASRLGRCLGMARGSWVNLQCHYDLARHLAVVLGCRAPRKVIGPRHDLQPVWFRGLLTG